MVAIDEPGARFAAPPANHIRPLRGRGERPPGTRRSPNTRMNFQFGVERAMSAAYGQTLNEVRAWLNDRPRPDFVLCIASGNPHDATPKPTMNTVTKTRARAALAQQGVAANSPTANSLCPSVMGFCLKVPRRSNATRKRPSADRHRGPEKTRRTRNSRSNPSPKSARIPF